MHRSMSYRKPVPPFIPSPPPSSPIHSLNAGLQQEEIPPLPEHWHDAIAQAHRMHDNHLSLSATPRSALSSLGLPPTQDRDGDDQILSEPSNTPVGELPRFASPAYLGTARVGKHRIYRPPTPPRGHKRPRLFEFQDISAESLDRGSKDLDLRRSGGVYAWSIGTTESSSMHASSISLPDTDWQFAQLSIDADIGEAGQPAAWWGRIKTLGVMIVNRLKGATAYGPALC
ncbi:hypothetical protein B0H15DRAFT_829604 [Mycena belliarum]|uniref:Uncharacterized protein n=1 Tax=Mycena belliarum TaxID=1033014 RepID=A0AAD6UB50_9AGAR|nr:hypothetical protein B0H15DRAFT_829604 [Mycena belliae]